MPILKFQISARTPDVSNVSPQVSSRKYQGQTTPIEWCAARRVEWRVEWLVEQRLERRVERRVEFRARNAVREGGQQNFFSRKVFPLWLGMNEFVCPPGLF